MRRAHDTVRRAGAANIAGRAAPAVSPRARAARDGGKTGGLVVAAVCIALVLLAPGILGAQDSSDPLEPVNRKVFWFNDKVDIYVAEPISTGWDFIAPARVKNSVANFFTNLRFPINAVNNLLQAKPRAFLVDVGRFLANTTVGVAGLFDPATDWGLELRREDFGQTLGVWGLGGGPYLVIPILGPSNLRDTIGLSVDSLTAVYPWLIPWAYSFGGVAVNTINTRAMLLSVVRDAKGAAIDYYSFVRNAYGQRRKAMISDRPEMTNAEQEDLYQVDTDGEP